MSTCHRFQPDNIFSRFQVIEVPTSFVGLSTSIELEVEADLTTSAYIKTSRNGVLLKFEDARDVSPSHRAYKITQINKNTIKILFEPTNECITKSVHGKQDKKFVFDLRLIRVDDYRCCADEFHSEIGRYYICGQYEYCNITHSPHEVEFGDVLINTASKRYVVITNNSDVIAAKFCYVKTTGFMVYPDHFTIAPKTSIRISISIRPVSLTFKHCCTFKIKNPNDTFVANAVDENCLTYNVPLNVNLIPLKKQKIVIVESLHKINEPDEKYTYIGEELEKHRKLKEKVSKNIAPPRKTICRIFDKCYSEESLKPKLPTNGKYNFCKRPPEKLNTYDLVNIFILPFFLDFGKVATGTYGEDNITIKNNTKFEIAVKLFNDDCILYTPNKLRNFKLKVLPFTDVNVLIFSRGSTEGDFERIFEYSIDSKYIRKHPYKLEVEAPALLVKEMCLKFGMVTNENFVVSVPLTISNIFNVPVNFHWEVTNIDTPFEVIPITGTIPSHTSKMCEVIYTSKLTKSKVHEVNLMTDGDKVVPVELNVITKKISIKFLQAAVLFKEVALNLETIEEVKLENSSREVAIFYVVEPLIPGLQIEPMSGAIRPKMIITFKIIVKIACILDFSFDIHVKINNKETLTLPVSGSVVEPKIVIYPKNIYMPCVPCHMVTYVPVTFQNVGTLQSVIEILDTDSDDMFNVYVAIGNEKQRIFQFCVEVGQVKTVFIRVYDIFRREYDMYIPFKINGLIGPPDQRPYTTELRYYVDEYEKLYENNYKVKLLSSNKNISFCRVVGVITVPWIKLSLENFEIKYEPNQDNSIKFTMMNVSRYHLYISILIAKLVPNFSLTLLTEQDNQDVTDAHIQFEMDPKSEATLSVKFHPKIQGVHGATAVLFLDKQMTLPYYNLTFVGRMQTPIMKTSDYKIIFPPCPTLTKIRREITITFEEKSDIDDFVCICDEELYVTTNFTTCEVKNYFDNTHTIVTVEVIVSSEIEIYRDILLSFCHQCGSACEVELSFWFTNCALILHTNFLVPPEDHPYPYYPLMNTHHELYDYMNICVEFLEKWMFQQGFRKDLFPVIPDTFHAISSSLISGVSTKTKGPSVSFLNFVRRISGPYMRYYVNKSPIIDFDPSYKAVKEIHDTYREILIMLKCRGAEAWGLQARFLLSHEQFVVFCQYDPPKCNTDFLLTQELLSDVNLFERLNKQSWVDFILQIYKVFVMDSCLLEDVQSNSQPRDLVTMMVDWYNENIDNQHQFLRGSDKPVKVITNITTDLSDGIAVISAVANYCSFMDEYFTMFCEVDEEDQESGIINNVCLILEILNQLKINFPITCKDFMQPNFLQMLFFSIHLFITLPMIKPKDCIEFNPPLLGSAIRRIAIFPKTQESFIYSYIILNNNTNNFEVEKAASGDTDNEKKMNIFIKYTANFVEQDNAILLIHGYNKARLFDIYTVFTLHGTIKALSPTRKTRVSGIIYRPNKVDVLVSSPFPATAIYKLYITDTEPNIPFHFEENVLPRFYVQRLNLIDKEIELTGMPTESSQEIIEHKLYLHIICLSSQVGNSWIWFRGEPGEFFIKVTSQPRWDMPLEIIRIEVPPWYMGSCHSCCCLESCVCGPVVTVFLPHCNELMVAALRHALLQHASPIMMDVFDNLIETTTGRLILEMLLADDGTKTWELRHILQKEIGYNISSRLLKPSIEHVVLAHHTSKKLSLTLTIPRDEKPEMPLYAITLTSDCGMDIRYYKIVFVVEGEGSFI